MSNLKFNDEKSIDDFFADFLEYRKSRNEKAVPTMAKNGTKKFININEIKDEVMPPPLETLKNLKDMEIDKYSLKILYNRLSEQLLPYIEKVVGEWSYDGSPIYDVEVSRDTVGTITDKVIYLASQDIPKINEILESDNFGSWSDNEMLRSIVESIVINEIFIEKRINQGFKPNNNTTDPNKPQIDNNEPEMDYDLEDFI